MTNVVTRYGWSSKPPTSCNYLSPTVFRLLKRLEARRILDLGCGNGSLSAELSADGYEVVGVDADREAIALASAKVPNVSFYRAEFGSPGTELRSQAPFDAVVSTEVIEHLYSPHDLIRLASTMLRPGGFLIISTPYHGFLKNLALSLANRWDWHFTALWHGGHIKFWSRKTLSQLLKNEGFVVDAFYGAGGLPFLWKSMVLVAHRT